MSHVTDMTDRQVPDRGVTMVTDWKKAESERHVRPSLELC